MDNGVHGGWEGSVQPAIRSLPVVGGVREGTSQLPWLVFFPDGLVHDGAAAWFRELGGLGCESGFVA